MPSGFTSALANAICPDVAVLYYDVSGTPTVMGVSRGGLTFEPDVEMRNVEFDGKRSNIELLDRVTKRTARFSGTIIEASNTLIGLGEAGSTSATAGTPTTVTITPKAASTMFVTGNYLTNVDMVWTRGDTKTVRVRFAKAIFVKPPTWKSTDNNETEMSIEIECRLGNTAAISSTDTAPYLYHIIG